MCIKKKLLHDCIFSTTSKACCSSENAACSFSCRSNDDTHFNACTHPFLCTTFHAYQPGLSPQVTCSVCAITGYAPFTFPSGKIFCRLPLHPPQKGLEIPGGGGSLKRLTNFKKYRKIPISPGLIFVQKVFLPGLFSGELIFGGACYRKEFGVSKWVWLVN